MSDIVNELEGLDMNYKDFEFWNKEKLWRLRQEIILGSIFYNDYSNSFEIPLEACCDFFDGFIENCWNMEEENENGLTELQDLYDKYDNAERLWDYFYGIEYPFGEQELAMLYHGSNTYINDQLIPHKSFHYKPYVYATSDIYYAIVRAGKFDVGNTLFKEDYDGTSYTLIELKKGALEEAFDTDGFVYAVNESTLSHTDACMPNEFISSEPCDIIDVLYLNNILEVICSNKDYYKIIRYGSKEEKEYWETVNGGREGYLKRREERIKKLL